MAYNYFKCLVDKTATSSIESVCIYDLKQGTIEAAEMKIMSVVRKRKKMLGVFFHKV
jgi:hypothetical protein